jgi:BirA family biotin operon repressor/biotin-[acetyl-CoA-carboxylase] ligase
MNERILQIFLDRPGQFLSGEELSRELGCSRTAIWKHIRNLRDRGYEFEAVSRRGYRMVKTPDRLDVGRLLTCLKTRTLGRSIRLLQQVDSTQNLAHQLVIEGAEEGTLVLAEQQTAGRGRLGRSWHSPFGKGIWMSLILFPQIPLQFTSQLTLLVAVAVCRAIRQNTGVEAGIKWPNDLLVRGRKVCGILLESSGEDERLRHVVAGIGISVNLLPEDFPGELRGKATSLRIESGRELDRTNLIAIILQQLEELYDLYHREGFAPIRLLWEAGSISLGKPIRIQTREGWVQGVAETIDDFGALALRTDDGQLRKFYSGDVELA